MPPSEPLTPEHSCLSLQPWAGERRHWPLVISLGNGSGGCEKDVQDPSVCLAFAMAVFAMAVNEVMHRPWQVGMGCVEC